MKHKSPKGKNYIYFCNSSHPFSTCHERRQNYTRLHDVLSATANESKMDGNVYMQTRSSTPPSFNFKFIYDAARYLYYPAVVWETKLNDVIHKQYKMCC